MLPLHKTSEMGRHRSDLHLGAGASPNEVQKEKMKPWGVCLSHNGGVGNEGSKQAQEGELCGNTLMISPGTRILATMGMEEAGYLLVLSNTKLSTPSKWN